ncbi:MAG: ABC transporter ATP-binding protein [Deltaproteobacteria bacterium]|nr:ABC transporter ATP-binding protein [Deltaproteobacteria bacterium]
MTETAIEIRDLTLMLGKKTVLGGISLDVPLGSHVAVIGPNGAGKTTLLKCLMGIYRPTGGGIRLFGRPLGDHSRRALARTVSFVPQSDELSSSLSVDDFVLMGRYPYLDPLAPATAADRNAVDDALRLTDIVPLRHRALDSLSGGERQRALVAAVIAQGAKVMLLDEPTGSLDPRHKAEILGLIEHLRRTLNLTIVTVTHDINEAALWSDRVVALKQGRVVFSGDGWNLMCGGVLEEVYEKRFVFAAQPDTGALFVAPEGRPR